jgi:indolepyruvate ferredoxin oxidoreductase alpha subunit
MMKGERQKKMHKLMTGNEAVARGAFEAGCMVATAYPGTPSTEILENVATYQEIYSQWSPNEKVAVEVACGASVGGSRALSVMKVVGLNVAMDPLMTFSYLGANGGLVIVVADDPGCSSSQTEQDNRLIAPFAKIPLFEPSDSQECKDYIKRAFQVSEQYGTPVLFRMTTRVCHSKGIVKLGNRVEAAVKEYVKTGNYCSTPALARKKHAKLEEKLIKLEEYANNCPLNKIEWGSKDTGIITSGISYQHAREVFGNSVSYLKLGFTHPIPQKLIKKFAMAVNKLYVIEENEPYLENSVKQMGIECIGKDYLPKLYELTPEIIRDALRPQEAAKTYSVDIKVPDRPPVLCPGCPHRTIFYAVSKYKDVVAANDIGCYTLGMMPPLNVTDTIICMGAGISAGIGMEKSFLKSSQKKKVFGFIGDSTFFHSGITALIDAVWNKSSMAICILDNSTTAMTGHQENPGTGKTLMGEDAPLIDIEKIVKAVGVKDENIRVVDAYNLKEVEAAVKAAHKSHEVFVIIAKQPCPLLKEVQKKRKKISYLVDQDKCKHCNICMGIGCPAIVLKENTVSISQEMCNGCDLCRQVCKVGAITRMGE